MTTTDDKFRYYPYIERSGFIVDQTDRRRYRDFMDHAFDGAAFHLYDHNGRINKGLPLTLRPPINKVLPGFRGDIVNAQEAPTFYDCQSCYGNRLMNPGHRLERPS